MAIEVQFMKNHSLKCFYPMILTTFQQLLTTSIRHNYCTSLPPLNFADKEEQVCSDGRYSQLYSADLPAVPPPT